MQFDAMQSVIMHRGAINTEARYDCNPPRSLAAIIGLSLSRLSIIRRV